MAKQKTKAKPAPKPATAAPPPAVPVVESSGDVFADLGVTPTARPGPLSVTGVTMFRVPGDGWSLVKLNLAFTPGSLELLSWETVGEPTQPHNHAVNALKVFVARQYIHPDLAAGDS